VALVDTSAWIEYLRHTGSPINDFVRSLADERSYATTDVILAELRMGARTEQDARRIHRIADSGRFFAVRPLFDYETAADIYRSCRRDGITPRSLADCLVAAVAINNDLEVLSADRDFAAIAEHSALRLTKV